VKKQAFPDGVLVVDKTEGPTSHDVVTLARRALGVSRIGHTGTLDPMATGVLPLVIGRATRLAQFLTASDKSYEATVAFGRTTDTLDASGTIVTACDRRPTRDELAQAIGRFRGRFDQTPPVFSAKNIDGERSYDLARRGKLTSEARPKAVSVNVKRLEILSFDGNSARLEMQVTAGFYVRSLAHDLGVTLGTGAHLVALRRTRSGDFTLRDSVALDVLERDRGAALTRFVPLAGMLLGLSSVVLTGEGAKHARHGRDLGPADLAPESSMPADVPEAEVDTEAGTGEPPPRWIRLLDQNGALLGLARTAAASRVLHPSVVLM